MDPQQQQQFAGVLASMGIAFFFVGILITAFFIFCLWRIFTKAGMAGALSLIAIVPMIGPIIVLCILAFGQWRVTPVAQGYANGVQPYPPQPYPPSNYPPAGPPTQL